MSSFHPRPGRPQHRVEEQTPAETENFVPRKKPSSLFLVSEEMIEATTTTTTALPSPDFTDSIEDTLIRKDDEEKSVIDNQEELDLDADSLDEGVGDVSSDGEHQLSPVCENSGSSSSSSCEIVAVISKNINTANPHPLSPVKERIPSRFFIQ